jgi:hypothetical protein
VHASEQNAFPTLSVAQDSPAVVQAWRARPSFHAIDDLQSLTGYRVLPVIATKAAILTAIELYYDATACVHDPHDSRGVPSRLARASLEVRSDARLATNDAREATSGARDATSADREVPGDARVDASDVASSCRTAGVSTTTARSLRWWSEDETTAALDVTIDTETSTSAGARPASRLARSDRSVSAWAKRRET